MLGQLESLLFSGHTVALLKDTSVSAALVLHAPLRYGKSHALQQLHLLTLYPIKVDSNGKSLIDGGLGANNLSNEAWTSIRQLHSDHQDLVSIATGNSLPKRRARANCSTENAKGTSTR